MSETQGATQKTQPHGIDPKTDKPYESVEIPVPKREDINRLIRRAAKTAPATPANGSTAPRD